VLEDLQTGILRAEGCKGTVPSRCVHTLRTFFYTRLQPAWCNAVCTLLQRCQASTPLLEACAVQAAHLLAATLQSVVSSGAIQVSTASLSGLCLSLLAQDSEELQAAALRALASAAAMPMAASERVALQEAVLRRATSALAGDDVTLAAQLALVAIATTGIQAGHITTTPERLLVVRLTYRTLACGRTNHPMCS
jgi:hypothetical protein